MVKQKFNFEFFSLFDMTSFLNFFSLVVYSYNFNRKPGTFQGF